MLFHIYPLPSDRQPPSPRDRLNFWEQTSVHIRLLCTLLLVVAIALTPIGKWWTWAWYGLPVVMILYWSQIDLGILVKRMAIELLFASVVFVGVLFRDGGSVIWQWGWLKITTNGLTVLGSVSIKSFLSLLLLNILTLSIPIPSLLQALIILKMPPLLVSIMAAMYRYMAVLSNEFQAMRRAATARNFDTRNLLPFQKQIDRRWQRQVLGNMLGMLFIRTYYRGDRIYQAMLARGYQGIPRVIKLDANRSIWRDRLALGGVMIVIVIGILIGQL